MDIYPSTLRIQSGNDIFGCTFKDHGQLTAPPLMEPYILYRYPCPRCGRGRNKIRRAKDCDSSKPLTSPPPLTRSLIVKVVTAIWHQLPFNVCSISHSQKRHNYMKIYYFFFSFIVADCSCADSDGLIGPSIRRVGLGRGSCRSRSQTSF